MVYYISVNNEIGFCESEQTETYLTIRYEFECEGFINDSFKYVKPFV